MCGTTRESSARQRFHLQAAELARLSRELMQRRLSRLRMLQNAPIGTMRRQDSLRYIVLDRTTSSPSYFGAIAQIPETESVVSDGKVQESQTCFRLPAVRLAATKMDGQVSGLRRVEYAGRGKTRERSR